VSGSVLSELGCGFVAVGHAERRRLFGESNEVVALKVGAALRNRLCPVICVGEAVSGSAAAAFAICAEQLTSALSRVERMEGRVIVAYEPQWAIGADNPAPAHHISSVCGGLRTLLAAARPGGAGKVIYGGSAGPGLLMEIGGDVDGLFLGRRVHDPAALKAILDQASLCWSVRSV